MTHVFVIHGMGHHKKGWWDGEDGTLSNLEKLKRYDDKNNPQATLKDFFSEVTCHEILYDDLNQDLFEATDNGQKIKDLAEFIGKDILNKESANTLTEWQNQTDPLFTKLQPFNHSTFTKDAIWDVFLCANRLTRHYLALHVANQMLKVIQDLDGEPWSVLAHSLGTALVQDALNYLYEGVVGSGDLQPARCVGLFANFSLTIVDRDKPLLVTKNPASSKTKVWPTQDAHLGESICSSYLSARHSMDPLSYLAKEMPAHPWLDKPHYFNDDKYYVYGHKELQYLPKNLPDDLLEAGTHMHSLENYLADPRLHLTFFDEVLGKEGDYKQMRVVSYNRFLKTRRTSTSDILSELIIPENSKQSSWVIALATKFGDLVSGGA